MNSWAMRGRYFSWRLIQANSLVIDVTSSLTSSLIFDLLMELTPRTLVLERVNLWIYTYPRC